MRIVGVLYIALGLPFIPVINATRIGLFLPGLRVDTLEYRMLLDYMFLFGLDLTVIGAMLLLAARDPIQNIFMVYTLIALEAVSGIADDLYMLPRGYFPGPFFVAFIALHVVIIGSAVVLVRAARASRIAAITPG
jgi:hypothetical protein